MFVLISGNGKWEHVLIKMHRFCRQRSSEWGAVIHSESVFMSIHGSEREQCMCLLVTDHAGCWGGGVY